MGLGSDSTPDPAGAGATWPTRDPLSHRASTTPDRTALIDVETDAGWSFAAFDRRVDRVATALADVADDRLAVLLNTRPAFATIFFAAMRSGLTVVPLNVRETAAELGSKVERTEVEAVVCERDTDSLALDVADDIDQPDRSARSGSVHVLSVDQPESADEDVGSLPAAIGDAVDDSAVGRASSSSSRPPSDDATAIDPEDVALIMFTSGTSGEPKAVQLTVANLIASATASAFRLGVDREDRWLCCLPMYHMGGLAPVLRSTLYGTTVVIQRAFDARETARVLDEYDVTGVSLVPTMCKRLLDAGWDPASSLRFVLLGGAPASNDLLDRCLDAGVPVHPTFGMTETASQIATATPADVRAREGTVGQPLVNTDVTVLDEDGDPISTGDPGELIVSGATVTPGYLDPEQTDAAFGEYGLHTGDVGYRDEDGYLWVLNRRSDRIVTGGENVDPGEVIAALREHSAVEDAVVVGLGDPEWGERVGALVVPATEDGTDAPAVESLVDHCGDHLAGFKKPKTIGFADELPRTASGTVDREDVRERLREDGTDLAE